MSSYIRTINVEGVEKQIDYTALANLPNIQTALSDTDGSYGQRIKTIEDTLALAIDFETQTY